MNNLTNATTTSNPFLIILSWIIVVISICFIFYLFIFVPRVLSKSDETAYQIAQMYESTNDYNKAVIWLEKANDEGNTFAANDLGVMYSRGSGVEKNIEKAKTFYRLAANRGDYYGMYNLGLMYSNLNHRTTNIPTKNDFKLAIYWYQKSLEGGIGYCGANDLGVLYATGQGVNQNSDKAKEYFRKSVSLYLIYLLQDKNNVNKLANGIFKVDLSKIYSEYQLLQAQHKDSLIAFQNLPAETSNGIKDIASKVTNDCWS